jgi:hypothetical protein
MGRVSLNGLERVLLIESGPRSLGEKALNALYEQGVRRLDILTCYEGIPEGFDPQRGEVISVHGPEARAGRFAFIQTLCARPYSSVAILAVGSRVLRPWKWAVVFRSLSRLLLVDEQMKVFPVAPATTRQMCALMARRLTPARHRNWGLPEAMLTRACELLLTPFEMVYLVLYTAKVHTARRLRLALRQVPHS